MCREDKAEMNMAIIETNIYMRELYRETDKERDIERERERELDREIERHRQT